MDVLVLLEMINTGLIILGVFLITIPRIEGLYVMVVGQIGWSIFSYYKDHDFFLVQSIVLLIFNFIGICNWRKKNVG